MSGWGCPCQRRAENSTFFFNVHQTPIAIVLDLKPYLSNIPEEKLRRGWLAEAEARRKP